MAAPSRSIRTLRWSLSNQFFVYTYRRPDGSLFYIGKGTRRRALSVSPSRRTLHFLNIVRKYGQKSLVIALFPCPTEAEAFTLERQLIAEARAQGESIINLTDGGEGASGRHHSEKARAAFAEWHGSYHRLPEKSKRAILDGLAVGRSKLHIWRSSEAGQAHMKRLAELGRANFARTRAVVCCQCGATLVTRSHTAKCCSRLCEQRHRRARDKERQSEHSHSNTVS